MKQTRQRSSTEVNNGFLSDEDDGDDAEETSVVKTASQAIIVAATNCGGEVTNNSY